MAVYKVLYNTTTFIVLVLHLFPSLGSIQAAVVPDRQHAVNEPQAAASPPVHHRPIHAARGDQTGIHIEAISNSTTGSSGIAAVRTGNRKRLQSSGRCIGTIGSWCGGYYSQQSLVPHKPPPVQSKPCPGGCSGVGVCDGHTGVCDCPAGALGMRPHSCAPCLQAFAKHLSSPSKDQAWCCTKPQP